MLHLTIPTNGIHLHVVQDGPPDAPLIILLHGFPECWYGWRQQIPALAAAGLRVWAPDMRGYNLSAKPAGVAAYALDTLAADVVGLIDAAGVQQAVIVGHDWGAAVAWWLAERHPARVAKLVIINAPHPNTLARALRSDFAQLRRSWYFFFFQLPGLPERLLAARNYRALAASLREASAGVTADDLAVYRAAWGQPDALTTMVNYYRAILRRPTLAARGARIRVPTLLIWGARDRYLKRELAQQSIDRCDDGRLVLIDSGSHWVHHEHGAEVSTLIADFVRANSPAAAAA